MKKIKLMGAVLALQGALACNEPAKTQAPVGPSAEPEVSRPENLPKAVRLALFDAVASEMERLDGEALMVRENRPTSWRQTVSELRQDLAQTENLGDFAATLARLDAAYPNLHATLSLGKDLEAANGRRRIPTVRFISEWLTSDTVRFTVFKAQAGLPIAEADYPKQGDEIVAINEKPMSFWKDVNFAFCKFPLRAQCDAELPFDFIARVLPLGQRTEMTYRLQRGDRVWTVQVPIIESPPAPAKNYDYLECKNEPNRYKDFTASYTGSRLCVYESPQHPSTAIMRITSFAYRHLPDGATIRTVEQEIDAIYGWWKEHATWDHLVIDVIENGGGSVPVPYYQILLDKPFQEQYFQLKKIPELLDPTLRKSIFWGSHGQEIWFQDIKQKGVFDATPMSEYLPRLPMLCADDTKNCLEGLFEPKVHSFRGRVSVLLNQWCVSSCDAFVYTLQEKLGERAKFYGHPQSGDTAYSRLAIHAFLHPTDPNIFSTAITSPRVETKTPPFFTQIVAVTRSVREDGAIQSGQIVPLNQFVPETMDNTWEWAQSVLDAALTDK